MLVLSRKIGEKIIIADEIVVKVLKIDNGWVSLGIDAPKDVPVHREEIQQRIKQENSRQRTLFPLEAT